jgi:hypothetical protein
MADGQPAASRRRGGRVDLLVGVLLGLVLGLAMAFLLVLVVGGGRDASTISTSSPAPRSGGATPGGPARGGRSAP